MTPIERSLHTFLRQLAAAQPEKKLLGDERGWLSAREVCQLVEGTARQLLALGITPGAAVALQTRRSLPTALMIFALRAAGALVVLCDPHRTPLAVLADCEADIPVEACISALDDGSFAVERGGQHSTVHPLCPGEAPAVTLPETDPRGAAFVIFTSGSTGLSKAVVLSEYNLVNDLTMSESLGCYSEYDIALGALPLEHVFGLVLLCGVLVLRYAAFFPAATDTETLLQAISRERITRMNGVPTLYLALARQRNGHDLSSLRAGFIGGGPVTPTQFMAIEQELGMTLVPAYGMTECIGITSASWRDPQAERAAGVGRFYPLNTCKVILEDGTEAAPGQVGEICVCGPTRMLGYWGQPLPEEAFLHTGDLGSVDAQGLVRLSGRKKDIIIRNGRNLSPRRIEEALMALPGVRTAIVAGIPDAQAGEVPCAMVTGREVDVAELVPLLPKNELPVAICTVEELPLTASGKLNRQSVREVLMQWVRR